MSLNKGASGSVVVSKLDKQTCKSEFESHWVPHSFGLVPHVSKKLSKLLCHLIIRWCGSSKPEALGDMDMVLPMGLIELNCVLMQN